MGQVCEHARRAARGLVHTARDWHQLLVLVRSWFRVPIYSSQAQLCVVE